MKLKRWLHGLLPGLHRWMIVSRGAGESASGEVTDEYRNALDGLVPRSEKCMCGASRYMQSIRPLSPPRELL